jgi:Tol biopolymer transport system component
VQIVEPESDIFVFAPTVTPDGAFVDFLRAQRTNDAIPSLWRVPFLGGKPQRLIDDVWSPVGWSPDGRRMAFVRLDIAANTAALVIADADGSDQRVVAIRTGPSLFMNLALVGAPLIRPAWSPDGSVIALYEVSTRDRLESRIVFVDVATGAETAREVHGGSRSQGLAWLGPGSLILNQPATLGRPAQLWRMSYPDGVISPLTNDLSIYAGVDIDAARESLVTSRLDRRTSLWISDAEGESIEIVPSFPFGGLTVWVGWLGDRVLYGATTPDGRQSIAALDPGGGAPQEIWPEGTIGAAGSPDGNTVVYSHDAGLWRLDDAERRPVPLVEGDASFPIISPIEREVIFVSYRSGVQSPWIVPLDGGEPVEVVREPASAGSLDISPDGRRLLFASTAGYVVCDLPACANRRDLPPLGALGRWMPDGQGIAYVDQAGINIWSVPIDGGAPRQITHFAAGSPDTTIAAFAWSHDGKHLAIVRATESSDIVLLQGLRE